MRRTCILLGVLLAITSLLACDMTVSPTPTQESELQIYIRDVQAFSSEHESTLESLASTIEGLSLESAGRANLGGPNLAGLLRVDTQTLSTDELLNLLTQQYDLSPELRESLEADTDLLEKSLLRVKRDQIALLKTLPPQSVSTSFHEAAAVAPQLEIGMIVSLLTFYSSPQLERKNEMFHEFPAKFGEAEAQLERANRFWTLAKTNLEHLADGNAKGPRY